MFFSRKSCTNVKRQTISSKQCIHTWYCVCSKFIYWSWNICVKFFTSQHQLLFLYELSKDHATISKATTAIWFFKSGVFGTDNCSCNIKSFLLIYILGAKLHAKSRKNQFCFDLLLKMQSTTIYTTHSKKCKQQPQNIANLFKYYNCVFEWQ